jgi:hypothetical protein
MTRKSQPCRRNDTTGNARVAYVLRTVPSDQEFLTTNQFAKLLNCHSKSILSKYSEDREFYGIQPKKFGGRLLWPVAQIAARLAQ